MLEVENRFWRLIIVVCTVLFMSPGIVLSEELAEGVSIFELIVSPEKFDGKMILVNGVLGMRGSPALYDSREDALANNIAERIFIEKSEDRNSILSKCAIRYVLFVGRFSFDGRRGEGSFTSIRSVDAFSFSDDNSTKVEACL